jgi:hypothetical protein
MAEFLDAMFGDVPWFIGLALALIVLCGGVAALDQPTIRPIALIVGVATAIVLGSVVLVRRLRREPGAD